MRITKYIHSCLLVEKGDGKILFDPGKFSFIEGFVKPGDFRGLSAIVLTHRHPDHVDDDALRAIVQNNQSAVVLTNTGIKLHLEPLGISAQVFETGHRTVAGLTLEAVGAKHAQILNAEAPQNTAYIVNRVFLHPGDSFDHSLDAFKGIPVLALPVMAPWNRELDVAEFALRISPKQIIPIHDGYAKDFFLQQRYENFDKYFSQLGIAFQRMNKPGDAVDVNESES